MLDYEVFFMCVSVGQGWIKMNLKTGPRLYSTCKGLSKFGEAEDDSTAWHRHRHSNSGPPFFLIWSLPRLWYGSLSGSISLNHLSIFYNIYK